MYLELTLSMLYTKSAAARILGNLAIEVERVDLVRGVVLVVYRTKHGRCSTFISPKKFKQDFVDIRREAGRTLPSVQINSSLYRVKSSDQGASYEVRLTDSGVACQCRDYREQIKSFGHGCCKHGYAVLQNWLGVSSLRDYLLSQKIAS